MNLPPRYINIWLASLECALLLLTARQLAQIGLTRDSDPDGYVSYVQEWRKGGELPVTHRRFPGYPAFLRASDSLIQRGLIPSAHIVQSVVGFTALAGFAFWTGRVFSRSVRIALLGLFAAPNFFVRSIPVILPDSLYTVLFVPFVILLFRWGLKPDSFGSKIFKYPLFAVGIVFLHLLRPSTAMLLGILCISALAAIVVCRRTGRLNPAAAAGSALGFGLVIVCCFGVQIAVNHVFDPLGAKRKLYDSFFKNKIATYTPAASASEADRRIEDTKQEFARAGIFVEREFFKNRPGFESGDLDQVAMQRLLHHPASFLGNAVGNDMRWNYHLTIANHTPFASYGVPIQRPYPPETDSWPSRLFRASGIETSLYSPALTSSLEYRRLWKKHRMVIVSCVALCLSVANIALVGGLLTLGIRSLWRKFPVPTVAIAFAIPLYYCFVAAVVIVDQRYLLPFSPFIYLAFAVALAQLTKQLSEKLAKWRKPIPLPEILRPEQAESDLELQYRPTTTAAPRSIPH